MPLPSSRTPEGLPNRCPVCGKELQIDPSVPLGDAPCPHCGSLVWFRMATMHQEFPFLLEDAATVDLDGLTKAEVLRVMVQRLGEAGGFPSEFRDEITAAIVNREELGSTGIGRGIAVPHGRHPSVPHVVGAWGFSAAGIDFNSLDSEPVHHVFLLVSNPQAPKEHLQALERLSRKFHEWFA